MSLYQLQNVDHFYGAKQVLAIEELAIPPASITGLIGPNGSGKSTLLKLLCFLEAPTYGTVLFQGRKVSPFSEEVRSKVTLLTQEPYLMNRSVYDNIAYGLQIRGDRRDIGDRINRVLMEVGLEPGKFTGRKWSALSGGEAQRVALAARLILQPQVLLLDEPTSSVDANSARLIRKASLRARDEWGTTLVVATHDWQWLYETCDTVVHLLHGRLFRGGLASEIYGPWRPGPVDLLQKELEDGQVMLVPKPLEGKEVVVLDPDRLKISLPRKDSLLKWNLQTLRGSVNRLFLERSGNRVQVAIKVGELLVTVRLDRKSVETLKLYPGKEVSVSYDPREVIWL